MSRSWLLALALLLPAVAVVAQTQPLAKSAIPVRAAAPDFAPAYQRLAPSVVSIRFEALRSDAVLENDNFQKFFELDAQENPVQVLFTSGVVFDEHQHVATILFQKVKSARVVLESGDSASANIVASDPVSGVTVLEVPSVHLPPAAIGDSSRLAVGEWAAFIGNEFRQQKTIHFCGISGLLRIQTGISAPVMNLGCYLAPGAAGGPVSNVQGEVIGLIVGHEDRYKIAIALPSNAFIPIAQQLLATGKIARGTLGIVTQEGSEDFGSSAYVGGALVTEVVASSAAMKAGIKVGDRVRKFDGLVIPDSHTLTEALPGAAVNVPLGVEVLRGGQMLKLSVTLVP